MSASESSKPTPAAPAAAAADLVVSVSPHIKAEEDIAAIMRMVAVALLPAYIWSAYIFGWRVIIIGALATAACCLCESVCQMLRERPVTVNDGSAAVTGLLLAAVIPPNVSWWVPIVGAVFAIGIAKHCFGGLGHNIWNPALLARAFLQLALPGQINSGSWARLDTGGGVKDIAENFSTDLSGSFDQLANLAESSPDVISSATLLSDLQKPMLASADAAITQNWGVIGESLLGTEGGCLGEVSALMLLLGGIVLLWQKIIRWEIPILYILTVGLLGWILPAPSQYPGGASFTPWCQGPWAAHLVGGGLFLGAFFMATDYVTSPMSALGRKVFGVGCGVLTIVIRLYAGYPEGVCYAILIMNTCVPLIDAWTRPVKFGYQEPKPDA